MRIYFDKTSDSMITDTVSGLNALASRLAAFLASSDQRLVLPADMSKSPAPYDTLLPGMEVEKQPGPILISADVRTGLRVVGSVENLSIWCSHFKFPATAKDGDHHHPEYVSRSEYINPRTLSVIIEVEDDN